MPSERTDVPALPPGARAAMIGAQSVPERQSSEPDRAPTAVGASPLDDLRAACRFRD